MFSLIITVISIALVVALVVATMYHGGSDVLTRGKQEAEITRLINDSNQVNSAILAYKAREGKEPSSLFDLVPNYLRAPPEGWGVDLPGQVAFEASLLTVGDDAVKLASCKEINSRKGITGDPPSCATIEATFSGCCVNTTP